MPFFTTDFNIVNNLRQMAENDAEEGEYHPAEHTCWMAADEIERLREIEKKYNDLIVIFKGFFE